MLVHLSRKRRGSPEPRHYAFFAGFVKRGRAAGRNKIFAAGRASKRLSRFLSRRLPDYPSKKANLNGQRRIAKMAAPLLCVPPELKVELLALERSRKNEE